MVNVDSDGGSDQQSSERCCGSYSLSADVSESESCSSTTSFSLNHYDAFAASSSFASSPRRDMSVPNFRMPSVVNGKEALIDWADAKLEKEHLNATEIEMMKERFSKLLLGEDMSGGGKGVCTALAISNAITNLSATVFGELWRLEPLPPQRKSMWRREMDWLLCVSDSIVELVPFMQQFPGGGTYEVMKSRPRSDLYINLPALKKLDALLVGKLDMFRDTEFWYVDRGIIMAEEDDRDTFISGLTSGRLSVRHEEKWWLPCPKVPSNGLSDDTRKMLQECRDCINQILKAAMAINSSVLSEMEIPDAYVESLPKNGKDCLGEEMYRFITEEQFSPEELLDCLDLSTEHHALDIANRIEAALNVWKLKDWKKHGKQCKGKHPSWSEKVKGFVSETGKNNVLARRAETLLQSLKLRYPGLAQTALDMNKIQYNKDVGQSILESYSRVMESLAFNIMARIDDVLYVDDATRKCAESENLSVFRRAGRGGLPLQKRISPSPFSMQHSPTVSPFATPKFGASTPVIGSPGRQQPSVRKNCEKNKLVKPMSIELEKAWGYAGKGRLPGDAPERD